MERFSKYVIDLATKLPIKNGSFSVKVANTETLATIFTDENGTQEIIQPGAINQTTGEIAFYVASGLYDVTITPQNGQPIVLENTSLLDPNNLPKQAAVWHTKVEILHQPNIVNIPFAMFSFAKPITAKRLRLFFITISGLSTQGVNYTVPPTYAVRQVEDDGTPTGVEIIATMNNVFTSGDSGVTTVQFVADKRLQFYKKTDGTLAGGSPAPDNFELDMVLQFEA